MHFKPNEVDQNRRYFNTFDYSEVSEVLPSHIVENNPLFVAILEAYYRYMDNDDFEYIDEDTGLNVNAESPSRFIKDLLNLRDVTSVDEAFIDNLKIELLLGREYFDGFVDERTALKYSNNLYRSKGSIFSIQQFFKMFYNKIVEVEYPKNNTFIIGSSHDTQKENSQLILYNEHKKVISEAYKNLLDYRDNGTPLTKWGKFLLKTQDYDILVGFTSFFRGDIVPSEIFYSDLEGDIEAYEDFLNNEYTSPYRDFILDNLFYSNLDYNDIEISKFDYRPKRYINTQGSKIGYESQKYITDAKLYQTLSILIKSDMPLSKWEDVYKIFTHPAGMYLGANVNVVENAYFDTTQFMPIFEHDLTATVVENALDVNITADRDITLIVNNDTNTEFRTNTKTIGGMSDIAIEQLDNTYDDISELAQASSPTMDNDADVSDTKIIRFDIDWTSLDTFDEDYYPPDSDGS